MRHLFVTAAAATVVVTTAATVLAAGPEVSYPEGYRSWTHVKSMVIQEGHPMFEAFGGIHHIYANPAAVAGYKSGTFADGAVIILDLLEAKATDDKALVEGGRKVVGVMERNAEKFVATGGWGYEGFKGDTQERVVGGKAVEACFGCHEGQKDKGFVFSAYRP